MSLPEPVRPDVHELTDPHDFHEGAPVPQRQNAFFGPLGLRAGWGILLYLVLALALGTMLVLGLFRSTGEGKRYRQESAETKAAHERARQAHQAFQQPAAKPIYVFLLEAGEAGAVLGGAYAWSFAERRRYGVYGLRPTHLRDALPGAVIGIVAISVLIGTLRALHLLVFDGQLLHGTAIVRYGAAWLAVFLLVGLFEEFLFRGYIQFTLMRGVLRLGERLRPGAGRKAAFWFAALVWSLLFSATHLSNAGEDPMGIVMVFVAGVLFSYALWKTGSLWWGIGFHMTWDWGQSFLYGVPDSGNLSAGRLFATHPAGHTLLSGGVAGPEGSVLVLPVLGLVALVLWRYPLADQPAVEPTSLPLVRGSAGETVIP